MHGTRRCRSGRSLEKRRKRRQRSHASLSCARTAIRIFLTRYWRVLAMTLVNRTARGTLSPQIAADGQRTWSQASARSRIDSIDLLRGVVMLLMALDHTRDFFAAGGFNPRDVADPALFLTRWITHFCAPVFIFLAGISAFLYGTGRGRGEVSRYLLTRGLFLILIELTVVRLGWTFSLDLSYFLTQVIFAIGASMVCLAALVHLPMHAIAAIGLLAIVGHNALDSVKPDVFGAAAPVWNFLHEPAMLQFADVRIFALYPLIPWIGVMAVGYVFGQVFTLDTDARRRWLVACGTGITAAFVLLRLTNLYGDPLPWSGQATWYGTVLSFVDCAKYPPSLLFLMMTIGPSLVLLAAWERAHNRLAGWVITFGRVPLFYYVAHLFLIHALAVAFALVTRAEMGWLFGPFPADKPAGYGVGLPGVYAVWVGVIVLLYPLCRWFAAVKKRHHEWWWSYL